MIFSLLFFWSLHVLERYCRSLSGCNTMSTSSTLIEFTLITFQTVTLPIAEALISSAVDFLSEGGMFYIRMLHTQGCVFMCLSSKSGAN